MLGSTFNLAAILVIFKGFKPACLAAEGAISDISWVAKPFIKASFLVPLVEGATLSPKKKSFNCLILGLACL